MKSTVSLIVCSNSNPWYYDPIKITGKIKLVIRWLGSYLPALLHY